MSDLCEEPHPDDPSILCDKRKPCYSYHQNQVARKTWPGREIPMQTTTDPMTLVRMAERIRRNDGR